MGFLLDNVDQVSRKSVRHLVAFSCENDGFVLIDSLSNSDLHILGFFTDFLTLAFRAFSSLAINIPLAFTFLAFFLNLGKHPWANLS